MVIKRKKTLASLDVSVNAFQSLDVVIYMTRKSHTTITGLHVLEMVKPRTNESISSLEKILIGYAGKIMKKDKSKAAQKKNLFFDRTSYGGNKKRIIDIAKRSNFDLIVIGSSVMTAAKEFFFGSTSNYVLHKSKKPVLIVK